MASWCSNEMLLDSILATFFSEYPGKILKEPRLWLKPRNKPSSIAHIHAASFSDFLLLWMISTVFHDNRLKFIKSFEPKDIIHLHDQSPERCQFKNRYTEKNTHSDKYLNFRLRKRFAFFQTPSWTTLLFLTWFWLLLLFFYSCGNRRLHLVLSPRIHLYIAHGKTWAQSSPQRTPSFCHPVDGNKQRPQPNHLHVQIQRVQNRLQEIIQRCFDRSADDWKQKQSATCSVPSGRFRVHSNSEMDSWLNNTVISFHFQRFRLRMWKP